MYKSLVVSIIDYCYVIYDCLRAADTSKLQKAQNSALCIVLQWDKRSHVVDLHQGLNLTFLANCGHLHTLHHVYKCPYGCEDGVCLEEKLIELKDLPPFTIAVADDAQSSDVILATNVLTGLQSAVKEIKNLFLIKMNI